MAPSSELYSDIHHVRDLDLATKEDLQSIIQTYPVIDNHAHNLLLEDHAYGSQDYPFECITSEAQGHALQDHVHTTLAHMRALNQLAQLFRCKETLKDIKAARYEWVRRDYPGMIQKCLQGTHAIMLDDGLTPEVMNPVKWHAQFVPTVSRIVRIESIASESLEQFAQSAGLMAVGMDADWEIDQTEAFLFRFNTIFRNQIRSLANDPNVRGFKSVVCYRSGLDVALDAKKAFRPHQSLSESSLLLAFHRFLQQAVRDHNYRVQQKEVNDYLVIAVCEVLEKLIDTDGESLPFQFHTGLGDTDIDLVKANPAYMQPLIEAFPHVDFVILHSAYPYTREAGYLAANYSNAWLDVGEVFPMLSRDGQESVLRQALELTPCSKILWSTDGHFYPETYWLANLQFRQALGKVLIGYVESGDMSLTQAINSAVDILFWNSNTLYKLDEERRYPQLLRACGRYTGDSQRTLVNGLSNRASERSVTTTIAVGPSSPTTTTNRASLFESADNMQSSQNRPLTVPTASNPTAIDFSTAAIQENVDTFEAFMKLNPDVKYIWLQFLDYTGTLRNRMVTTLQFRKQLATGKTPAITTALTRLLQDETPAAGCLATGQFLLKPDVSSLCLIKGISSPSATVQTWWMADTPSAPPTEHFHGCPRWLLQKQVDTLLSEHNVSILMGVEIEVVFMVPHYAANKAAHEPQTLDKSRIESFSPLHMVHSWSNMTYLQLDALPMIEEIVSTLAEIDIHVPQFHSEAAPGQWEFPLPHSTPVKAIDTLFKAKDVIRNIAKKYDLKATLYPRPYDFTCGTAAHTHFSLNSEDENVVEVAEPKFLAGVLNHLPAILALTLPLEESYERVQAGIWAGGEWVCWGTENKEVPLRKCGPAHYELKTVDGTGNAYLSMAALLAAGLHGLESDMRLTLKDCLGDPTEIGEQGRSELGITKRLPDNLRSALRTLEWDEELRRSLGDEVVEDYLALKRAEIKKLDAMSVEDRRVWLISRY